MRAGLLRHRVTIQSLTDTQDNAGGNVQTWANIADPTRWAQIVPATMGEKMIGGQQGARLTHKITMRNVTGILPTMRLIYGSRTFNIHSVFKGDEITRTHYLMATENA